MEVICDKGRHRAARAIVRSILCGNVRSQLWEALWIVRQCSMVWYGRKEEVIWKKGGYGLITWEDVMSQFMNSQSLSKVGIELLGQLKNDIKDSKIQRSPLQDCSAGFISHLSGSELGKLAAWWVHWSGGAEERKRGSSTCHKPNFMNQNHFYFYIFYFSTQRLDEILLFFTSNFLISYFVWH